MSSHTYRILGNLGSGSFGRVDHAVNEAGLEVAIKTFEPSAGIQAAIAQGLIPEKELKRRFFAEAKYQANIKCRIPDDHRAACGTGVGAPDTNPSWPA